MRADYKQLMRLQRSEVEHRRAIYGWNHPENVAWIESQGETHLRSYCRRIEERLRMLEATPAKRQRVADVAGEANLPYLEDINLPGHRDRAAMDLREKEWLVDPVNREAVRKLWRRIHEAQKTVMGNYGFLVGDQLEDDGIPEILVSHWRHIDYTATGERIEQIPGGMVARDLNRLGLKFQDVEAGTVVAPRRRPAPVSPGRRPKLQVADAPPQADEPLVIRRQGGRPHAK